MFERHPQLHVDIRADDRIVDMARDGIDVAIRTGSPASDQLVARPLGQLTRSLYASPAYLKRHGKPRAMADLARHRLLANSASPGLNHWPHGDPERLAGALIDLLSDTEEAERLLPDLIDRAAAVHGVAADHEDAIDQARAWFTYFPTTWREGPPHYVPAEPAAPLHSGWSLRFLWVKSLLDTRFSAVISGV